MGTFERIRTAKGWIRVGDWGEELTITTSETPNEPLIVEHHLGFTPEGIIPVHCPGGTPEIVDKTATTITIKHPVEKAVIKVIVIFIILILIFQIRAHFL